MRIIITDMYDFMYRWPGDGPRYCKLVLPYKRIEHPSWGCFNPYEARQ
jgi:hypothetical protein